MKQPESVLTSNWKGILASLVDRYLTLITVMMGRPRKVSTVTYSEIMVEFEL